MQALAKERVLLVDDEPQVLVALEDLLSERFIVLKTDSAESALNLIDREPEIAVVISDQRMPRMTGDELLARLSQSSDAQRILVTGFADLAAVVRAVNDGRIFAYITKPWNPDDLQLKVHTAAQHFRLAKELAQERQLLQEQTRVLNSILGSMAEGVIAADRVGHFLLFNPQAEKILGARPAESSAAEWAKNYPLYRSDQCTPIPVTESPLVRAMAGEAMQETETHVKNGEGSVITVTATPLRDENEVTLGGIALLRDVTQQRLLEQQFRQAQKMEAIGQLAGGVAHDFNNLLVVIDSYAELVMEELGIGDPRRDDLGQVVAAARRAAALTKQLLAFSRRQVVQPKPLQLNDVVSNVDKMLRRVIGEDIELLTELSPSLGKVRADSGQLEQIILNLTVNARDAMPEGGKLTIATASVTLDEQYAGSHPNVSPGSYVMLAVTDTGTGMDGQTQKSVFEPFFTTKEVGKGTGLGLSTVYGIVQQSGGHIAVDSEVSRGTSFKIYLPLVEGSVDILPRPLANTRAAAGTGTILLVEDDQAVRKVAARILRGRGYTVLETEGVHGARSICEQRGRSIDLLLTDVVMPEVTGPKLAAELCRTCPQMRVLYMSGYPGRAVVNEGLLASDTSYLEKPFTPASLTEKVRLALESVA